MKDLKKTIEAKILKAESGCWLWTDTLTTTGYGLLRIGRKKKLAHRLAYTLFKGEIPAGLQVNHVCDVRHCVNPEHLKLGTQKDNIREAVDKGRMAIGKLNGRYKTGRFARK